MQDDARWCKMMQDDAWWCKMMQDDDDNDDPMILNIRAKNHTSEHTIVPWTVIFLTEVLCGASGKVLSSAQTPTSKVYFCFAKKIYWRTTLRHMILAAFWERFAGLVGQTLFGAHPEGAVRRLIRVHPVDPFPIWLMWLISENAIRTCFGVPQAKTWFGKWPKTFNHRI